ncbi:MAG: hypothetical protein KDA88_03855 [Planctomycetaceae bacterium]|nr:hypothetical protein [Planctomycetaceae bacterium]MCB9950871.1 hypothetical protein [Planctomycetaceae bacterium]
MNHTSTFVTLLTLLALQQSATLHAAELEDGIYLITGGGGTEVTLFNGETVRIVHQGPLNHQSATVRSSDNNNTKYQLGVVLPFGSGNDRIRVLVANGVATRIYHSSKVKQDDDDDPWHNWYGQLQQADERAESLTALVEGLNAERFDRNHPGHVLLTKWKPKEAAYAIGSPVVLQMNIKNIGDVPMSFYNGGMQRGPRNNQFDFICRRGIGSGKALPDVGSPFNFGGIASKVTLEPGDDFDMEIDITKWFKFEEPDTYRVTGLFRLELQPTEDNQWWVLWEDLAVGECELKIIAKEDAAATSSE